MKKDIAILAQCICDLVEGGDTDSDIYRKAEVVMKKYGLIDEDGFFIYQSEIE